MNPIAPREIHGVRWWIDPVAQRPDLERSLADLDLLLREAHCLKDLPNKRRYELTLSGKPHLLKQYLPGRWLRNWKTRLIGSRARHEFLIGQKLKSLRIPAVYPVAAGERGVESVLIVEKLTDWTQLQEALLSPNLSPAGRRALCAEYGRFARRLHDAGVRQYDFNPTNVMVRRDGNRIELCLIDFERMTLGGPLRRGARLQQLARLNRFPRLSCTDRLRFLHAYLEVCEEGDPEFRRMVASLLRRHRAVTSADESRFLRKCMADNRTFAPFRIGDVRGFYRRRRTDSDLPGMTPEEIDGLARNPSRRPTEYRTVTVDDAWTEWKRANLRSRHGGEVPLAVFRWKGQRSGLLLYAPPSSSSPAAR